MLLYFLKQSCKVDQHSPEREVEAEVHSRGETELKLSAQFHLFTDYILGDTSSRALCPENMLLT